MTSAKQRFHAIDALRGLAIINMIIFHFLYDIFIVYGQDPTWNNHSAVYLWQQTVCCIFIYISGFVWLWGQKHNLRRGLCLNWGGLTISLVTFIFMPSEMIWFGILNFIGCAVLLLIPLHHPLRHIPPIAGALASLLLFFFCKNIPHGTIGLGNLLSIPLPAALYECKVLTPLGFPFPQFVSSDYFPVLPWFFLYLCGYFSQYIFQKHPTCQRLAAHNIPFLSAIGRQSLWIYLLHQPILMGICMFIFA